MKTPLGVSGVLERHKGLLTTALKAAAVAAPVLLSAAPSQAFTSTSKTFNGFTGAFAPAQWTGTQPTNGTTLTLNRAATVGSTSSTWTLDAAKLQRLIDDRPVNAKPVFLGGEFTFSWAWTPSGTLSADTGATATRNAFRFTVLNLGEVVQSLPISGARTGGVTVSGNSANPAGVINGEGDSLQFNLTRFTKDLASTTVSSTGTINNFAFTAFYEEVPGPLPLAGAAAAFAWSRRLRRRLNSAESPV
jgi:hypothetical protein